MYTATVPHLIEKVYWIKRGYREKNVHYSFSVEDDNYIDPFVLMAGWWMNKE